ncbi:hypothetical protein ARAM_005786 [Aspergillus rambellii]|uniref:Gfo/Idh/MocA-like oxidoreductase N-terminal domain-containing protein n=1 Tax=Aspergillus rambellii TaxID=308745 RepID=A0A0F8WJH4_9EURO|nr:hypothetical protein ARAM_005786 [Aspergillus rambellii]
MTPKILRVGLLTTGTHPIQTIYLPTLRALNNLYTIAAIYDASQPSLESPTLKADDHDDNDPNPSINPRAPSSIITDPTIDLILNFMPNEYHETYTIAALRAGKHVMVETPISLSIPSARRIIETEREAPNGAKVFVASARRYAPCFEEVFKREVKGLERIHYARCRMIAGPHQAHSATALGANNHNHSHSNDHLNGRSDGGASRRLQNENKPNEGGLESGKRLLQSLLREVFGEGEPPSQERIALSRFLSSLGCHDLGLMRDTLGYPDAISNISVNEPFYSALFHYTAGGAAGEYPFTLMYETGTDGVPRCDAQLAVYGHSKTVTIHYDLPYARGQPLRVVVETADERGALTQTETVSTWEEAYQEELRALYAYLVEGKPAKTTARDALQDLKLFQTIFEQYDRQCGTIRSPLG